MSNADTVDAVVVSYNTRDHLRACITALQDHAPGAAINVVDNASTDGSPAMLLAEFPRITTIALDENIGFGGANNIGAQRGKRPWLLFINSDAEITPGAVEALIACLEADPAAVIAGPALHNADGSFQPSCRRFPTPLRAAWTLSGMAWRFPRVRRLDTWLNQDEHRHATTVDMVSGACFLVRRAWFDAIGGFDEELFLYEEETDLSLPARAQGLHARYCPAARVLHHGGASVTSAGLSAFSERHLFRSRYVVFRKHYGRIAARLSFLLDQGFLTGSATLNALLRRPCTAARSAALARRAWRESFQPIQHLRQSDQFLQ